MKKHIKNITLNLFLKEKQVKKNIEKGFFYIQKQIKISEEG